MSDRFPNETEYEYVQRIEASLREAEAERDRLRAALKQARTAIGPWAYGRYEYNTERSVLRRMAQLIDKALDELEEK